MAFRIHLLFVYTALVLLSLYNVDAFRAFERSKLKSAVSKFSWQNCGPSSDPVQVTYLNVLPDPVDIPGNFTINLNVTLSSAIPTDLHVVLTMEKKVGSFYVKIPCIDNVGSCTYGDLCKDWVDACPKYFEKYGIPCACPIPANKYSIPDAVLSVTSKLPSLITGEFRVTGNFAGSAGHIGCIQLDLTLKT